MKKSTYVDAFVFVVPKTKVAAYKKIAKLGAQVWMKHGALDYKECVGDDLNPNMGGQAIFTFPKMTKLKPDETVWFSFITYESKKHRNEVNKKVMKDPAMNQENFTSKDMPFDMKRMAFGGFKVAVDGKK